MTTTTRTLAALTLALLGLALSRGARADEIDLSDSSRGGVSKPATLVIFAEGGSNFSTFGNIGGALNYFNDSVDGEVEIGAGAGFPGVQMGINLRKLFGGPNDFLLGEIGLGYNTRIARGVDATIRDSGSKTWSDLGIGYEHRSSLVAFGISGGLAFAGFQSPSGYVRVSIGVGIW